MIFLETSPLDVTAVGALFLISMGLVKILELVIKNKLDPTKNDKPGTNGKTDKIIMLPKDCNECFAKILSEISGMRKEIEKLNQIDTIQSGIISEVKELKSDVALIKSTLIKKE